MFTMHARSGPVPRVTTTVFFFLLAWVAAFTPDSYGQCSFVTPSTGSRLTYAFELSLGDGKLVLHVTLEFRGRHDGTTELELPSDWAEQSHLEGQVTNLRTVSSDAVVLDSPRPDVKTLRYPPDRSVMVSYDLVKDWQGIFEYPKQFRAVLEPTFFEFTTQNALVHPKLSPTEVVNVNFDWQRMPISWTIESSFGADGRCQSFTGLWHQVNDALFAGGDFRIHRATVGGKPVVIAIRGKWSFADEDAVTQIQKIITDEREFWHDNDVPYYLVTLIPFGTVSGSSDGSAFTNAFWLYLPAQEKLSYGLQYLLAHEYFHAWNPLKMGAVQKPEEGAKWFSEGFTVYYADIILLRSGLLPFTQYIELLNRRIRDYESSPVKNLSNNHVVARYRENSVNQLPYVRGPILALWLDDQIRKQSNNKSSLDTVMLTLAREASRRPALELSSQRVRQVVAKYLNRRLREMFHSFVEEGRSIPIPNLERNPCVQLAMEEVWLFDLGFDADVLRANKRVSGVKQNSEAFKAGVRDGQEVFGMSIYWGDVNKPVRLTVRSGSGRKTIEYFPRAKGISIPQYHLAKKAPDSNPERCMFPSN